MQTQQSVRPSIGGVCFKYDFMLLNGGFSPVSMMGIYVTVQRDALLSMKRCLLIFSPGQWCKPGLSQVSPVIHHFSSHRLALSSLVLRWVLNGNDPVAVLWTPPPTFIILRRSHLTPPFAREMVRRKVIWSSQIIDNIYWGSVPWKPCVHGS